MQREAGPAVIQPRTARMHVGWRAGIGLFSSGGLGLTGKLGRAGLRQTFVAIEMDRMKAAAEPHGRRRARAGPTAGGEPRGSGSGVHLTQSRAPQPACDNILTVD